MARQKLESKVPLNAATIEEIKAAIGDLLQQHAEEVAEVIEESDGRSATVNFWVDLDCSESAPNIDVKMRFSASVTDKRTIRCDDPRQGTFTTMNPAQLREEKEAKEKAEAGDNFQPTKGKGRKKKDKSRAEESESEDAGEGEDKD